MRRPVRLPIQTMTPSPEELTDAFGALGPLGNSVEADQLDNAAVAFDTDKLQQSATELILSQHIAGIYRVDTTETLWKFRPPANADGVALLWTLKHMSATSFAGAFGGGFLPATAARYNAADLYLYRVVTTTGVAVQLGNSINLLADDLGGRLLSQASAVNYTPGDTTQHFEVRLTTALGTNMISPAPIELSIHIHLSRAPLPANVHQVTPP